MSSKNKKVTETEAIVTAEEAVAIVEETVIEKPAAKEAAVTVMYIGPSIPNVVQASTVFKDGVLSETLKKCVEEKPYMKKLLVPLAELPAAMKELNGSSALNSIYRRVKNEI